MKKYKISVASFKPSVHKLELFTVDPYKITTTRTLKRVQVSAIYPGSVDLGSPRLIKVSQLKQLRHKQLFKSFSDQNICFFLAKRPDRFESIQAIELFFNGPDHNTTAASL